MLIVHIMLAMGIIILTSSLLNVRRIILQLMSASIRHCWFVMAGMIVFFMVGYAAYGYFLTPEWGTLSDLIVPVIFFFGACFVWLSTYFALQTTKDLLRVARLEHENHIDPLTGVFNRRFMDHQLREEIAKAQRLNLDLSILMIDLDNFKRINDQHGHQAGDHILRSLSGHLASLLRDSDLFTRYGGEEFLVIVPKASADQAGRLAERLRQAVESTPFRVEMGSSESLTVSMTISIGVASYSSGHLNLHNGGDASTLIRLADECMYKAKHSGKNQVVVAYPVDVDLKPSPQTPSDNPRARDAFTAPRVHH